MKKLLVSCICFLLGVLLCSSVVFASEITDTGGGDVSSLTTTEVENVTTETTESTGDKYVSQMDEIMNQELVPDVDAEDFFDKIIGKLSSSMTYVQKGAAFILAIMFIIGLIVLASSALGSHKERIVPCAIALLVIALAFVGDIYVMDILGAFSNWMGK